MSYRGKGRGNNRKETDFADNYSQHDDRSGPPRRGRGRGGNNGYYDNNNRGGGGYRGNNYRGSRGRGYQGRGRGYNNSWVAGRGGGGRRGGRRYGNRDESPPPLTRVHEDEDGDVNMDGSAPPSGRFNPYARPDVKSRVGQRPQKRQPHQQRDNWYQITILNGINLDANWLHQELQAINLIQYHPVQYHEDGNSTCFFLKDRAAVEAIRSSSKKLTFPDNSSSIVIIAKPVNFAPISEDQIDKIKEVLSNRYDATKRHLDCSNLAMDQELTSKKIYLKICIPSHMAVVTKIISEHISTLVSLDLSRSNITLFGALMHLVHKTPDLKKLNLARNSLKYVRELERIKSWDLTELTLDQNPLCRIYKSQGDYIGDVREIFPNIEVLDGQTLPPPVKFDVQDEKLPTPNDNFVPEHGVEVIMRFVETYFTCFDDSREMLSEAYHQEAIFTMSMPSSPRGPPLSRYMAHTRNLHKMKRSSEAKHSSIVTSRSSIMEKLSKLPQTTTHLGLLCIDVPLVTDSIIQFNVRGTFKEGGQQSYFRGFNRSFLCQVNGGSLQIINEQFLIRNVTQPELQAAKIYKAPPKPAPTAPVAPPVAPTPPNTVVSPPNASEMIQAFAKESNMNPLFSQRCLEENGWDYAKAGQIFIQLQQQGKIPPEAFVK